MKVCIRTVGCRTNKADSDEMARALRAGGVEVTEDREDADWVVVNSCTVTAAADRDTRREAYRARRAGRDPRVLVVGCLPAALGTVAAWADQRTVLMADRDEAVRRIVAAAADNSVASRNVGPVAQRCYIKIQEGCEQRCTYCIVPDARGRPRSVPRGEVIRQVRRAEAEARRDVVLTGTHVGCWGADLEPAEDLAGLMGTIAAGAGPGVRFRLSSLEPQDCTPGILEAMRAPFCAHLHLSLQAGTDRILRRMGRPYDTEAFAGLLVAARDALGPELGIGVDVISGFPGETDEDFEAGLAFVAGLDLAYLHAFTYSPRPGTPAVLLPDPVPVDVARARTRRFRSLGEEMRLRFAEAMVGRELEAYIEGPWKAPGGGAGVWRGTTGNFLRARMRGEDLWPGTWGTLKVMGVATETGTGACAVEGVYSPR